MHKSCVNFLFSLAESLCCCCCWCCWYFSCLSVAFPFNYYCCWCCLCCCCCWFVYCRPVAYFILYFGLCHRYCYLCYLKFHRQRHHWRCHCIATTARILLQYIKTTTIHNVYYTWKKCSKCESRKKANIKKARLAIARIDECVYNTAHTVYIIIHKASCELKIKYW